MDVRIFAPAHEFVDSPEVLKEGVLAYRNALETLIAEGKRLKQAGVSAEDAPKQANLGPYASMYRYTENIGSALALVWSSTAGCRLPQEPRHADPEDSRLSFAQ